MSTFKVYGVRMALSKGICPYCGEEFFAGQSLDREGGHLHCAMENKDVLSGALKAMERKQKHTRPEWGAENLDEV